MKKKLLAHNIDKILPQIQCQKCGFQDCRSYAQAIVDKITDHKQCKPGGELCTSRIAHLLGIEKKNTNASLLIQNSPPMVAKINESECIGCTLCIQACPLHSIVGTPKYMHSVLEKWCTGCELCISACPVECIKLIPSTSTQRLYAQKKFADVSRKRYHQIYIRKKEDYLKKNKINDENIQQSIKTPINTNKHALILTQALNLAKNLRQKK